MESKQCKVVTHELSFCWHLMRSGSIFCWISWPNNLKVHLKMLVIRGEHTSLMFETVVCVNPHCQFDANIEGGFSTCCRKCEQGSHTSQCIERRRLKALPHNDVERKPVGCCVNEGCWYPSNARGGFVTCCGKCFDGDHTHECYLRRMHRDSALPQWCGAQTNWMLRQWRVLVP